MQVFRHERSSDDMSDIDNEFGIRCCPFSHDLAKVFEAHVACWLATSIPPSEVRSVGTIDDEPLPHGVARISSQLDYFHLKLLIHVCSANCKTSPHAESICAHVVFPSAVSARMNARNCLWSR